MGEISDYLAALAPAEAEALAHVIAVACAAAPTAVESRSYGMPALKVDGRPLLGVVAAKGHLSVFPFSPEVIEQVSGRLEGYALSKGTIRFSVAHPIPDDVVTDVVRLRLAELVGEPQRVH